MTPAERVLLLAVARHVHRHVYAGLQQRGNLFTAITAVEAESAPIYTECAAMAEPVKSCETCDHFDYGDREGNYCRRCRAKDYKFWEAKIHD